MILINDATDGNVFIPEDVFEEIAESVLATIQGHDKINGRISDIEPETHVEIVEEAANTIHKGITEYVDTKFLKDVKEDLISVAACSVARTELKDLFKRNMDNAASS